MENLSISTRLFILIITIIVGSGVSYLFTLLPGHVNYWNIFLGYCGGAVAYQIFDGFISYKRFKTLKWK